MSAQFFVEESRDFAEWRSFVDNCDSANIFQTSYWAKALEDAGKKAVLIVARDGSGDVKGGILAVHNKYSFMKFSVIQSISAVGGPLVYDLNDSKLLEIVLGAFDAKARRLGALHCFIRSFFPLDAILIERFNYKIESDRLPCTVILDLSKPIEELWKNMNKNTRWGIRKSEKAGVVVQEGKSLDDVFTYYQIHVQTCRRLRIPPMSSLVFKSVWNTFSPQDNIKVFLARYKRKPIAGNIVLRWSDKTWAWHGASLREYWRLHASQLLEWSSIKWAAENRAKTYDLLGIPCKKDKHHPKYGIYQYKSQFGGEVVRHGEYIKRYSPLKSAFFKNLVRIYTQFSCYVWAQKFLRACEFYGT